MPRHSLYYAGTPMSDQGRARNRACGLSPCLRLVPHSAAARGERLSRYMEYEMPVCTLCRTGHSWFVKNSNATFRNKCACVVKAGFNDDVAV